MSESLAVPHTQPLPEALEILTVAAAEGRFPLLRLVEWTGTARGIRWSPLPYPRACGNPKCLLPWIWGADRGGSAEWVPACVHVEPPVVAGSLVLYDYRPSQGGISYSCREVTSAELLRYWHAAWLLTDSGVLQAEAVVLQEQAHAPQAPQEAPASPTDAVLVPDAPLALPGFAAELRAALEGA